MSERQPAVGKSDNPLTLVIDGQSLKHALSHDLKMDFLELCMSCKSVICCRVSPMQKAEVCFNSTILLYIFILSYLKIGCRISNIKYTSSDISNW